MRVIKLTESKQVGDLIVSVETITPKVAAAWLEQNKLNRPLTRKHVHYLADQIHDGLWTLNGEAIVVSDTEDVLDGQHRLHAVIESGKSIKSLVVYGVTREAFKTINTGKVRSGSDALWVFAQGHTLSATRAVAGAIAYCKGMEQKKIRDRNRVSNAEVIEYVTQFPSLWDCAETILQYPRTSRLLTVAIGTACFEMFRRKDPELAAKFIQKIYTGEDLAQSEPEYVLRQMFINDLGKNSKLPDDIKARMTIKAWNLRRRGFDKANTQAIAFVQAKESAEVIIL